MDFSSLNLHPIIQNNIQALGYTTLTPIQEKAIPAILEGKDLIGLAPTGTGKTAAFVIPVLQRLSNGPRRRLRALVVGPTRELAEQTLGAFSALGRHTRVQGVAIYGGVGMWPQISGLRHGAEVAVACPGRLLDHMRQGHIRLSTVECLILDEADRMFDMGFLPDVRKILEALPPDRQTMLFSATMPKEVRQLAHDALRHPVTIEIGHSRPAESVAHALYPVPQHLKTNLLMALLNQIDRDSVLIFTRTKHRAKRLAEQLAHAGHATACLQGNLSQRQRKSALDGFRSGRHQILVATDLAARGIDVSSISHVVNFDMPGSVDDYIHRIGRTGRAAKTGDAFTLVTREDESSVRPIERILGGPIERRQLAGFNYADKPPHGARSGSHPPHHDGRRPAEHGSRGQAASTHRPAGGPHSHTQRRPHSHSPHRSSNEQSSPGSGHRAAHPAHHHSNERRQHRS